MIQTALQLAYRFTNTWTRLAWSKPLLAWSKRPGMWCHCLVVKAVVKGGYNRPDFDWDTAWV